MNTAIRMPQLGESITEGTVSRWLKQPGDQVAKYEPLLEVTTDKVDSEVPSPLAGVLLEITVAEGTTVPVGTLLAHIGTSADPAPPAAPQSSQRTSAPPVSPLVARMVSEHGIDLSSVVGTGLGGRISKQDVLQHLERQSSPAEQPHQAGPAEAEESRTGEVPAPAFPDDVVTAPLSAMRRSIAEHMRRSVQTAPHATSVIEVDMQRVAAHRARERQAFEAAGVRLTLTAYFVAASSSALRAVPLLNARYSDEGVLFNRRVHIGVAVALDDGLLVPVIRDADEKTLLGLARAVNTLSAQARSRQLRPADLQGGTFSISNYGVGGTLLGTPIINQPQSAILGCGAVVKRPVVITADDQDSIAIRPICYLSLSFDHRLIDGAIADRFLSHVRQTLEQFT